MFKLPFLACLLIFLSGCIQQKFLPYPAGTWRFNKQDFLFGVSHTIDLFSDKAFTLKSHNRSSKTLVNDYSINGFGTYLVQGNAIELKFDEPYREMSLVDGNWTSDDHNLLYGKIDGPKMKISFPNRDITFFRNGKL